LLLASHLFLASLLLLLPAVSGILVVAVIIFIPDVLTDAGLPAIDGAVGVVGVHAVAFVAAVADVSAVAVASVPADPGVPSLAGVYALYCTARQVRLVRLRLWDCVRSDRAFFLGRW
jgi:hypothetical protein